MVYTKRWQKHLHSYVEGSIVCIHMGKAANVIIVYLEVMKKGGKWSLLKD